MHGNLTFNFAGIPVNSRPITRQNNFSTRFTPRNSVQTASSSSSASYKPAASVLQIRTAGSLYEVLRVERTASLPEIKVAYRSLAKMYHPDAVGSSSDGQDFIEIHNAYATLSDPAARAMYDLSLGVRARRVRCGVYPTRTWETDQCW